MTEPLTPLKAKTDEELRIWCFEQVNKGVATNFEGKIAFSDKLFRYIKLGIELMDELQPQEIEGC